ncbi:hypothetical protein SDC9_161381 [bioreactor metagenome]|uniref:Uncharacterized protein n=1 Tax=bioreactor metagenome TaxID=1076179 RepID=A0A645FI01_9ZZZZ
MPAIFGFQLTHNFINQWNILLKFIPHTPKAERGVIPVNFDNPLPFFSHKFLWLFLVLDVDRPYR